MFLHGLSWANYQNLHGECTQKLKIHYFLTYEVLISGQPLILVKATTDCLCLFWTIFRNTLDTPGVVAVKEKRTGTKETSSYREVKGSRNKTGSLRETEDVNG